MEQKHVENISTLIRFMEGLANPGFTMERFVHGCGSPACAFGWACTVPALAAQGCDLRALRTDSGLPYNVAPLVFGTYGDLFPAYLGGRIKTPQEWAQHAREYLRKRGHEVVPADDGFKAFMAKALKAVALEQAA